MRSAPYLPQLLTVFLVSAAAAAQSPWGFPLGQRFVAVSLNGQTYDDKAPTFAVKADSDRMTGAGFAGCNTWFGQVRIGQNAIDVSNLGSTKMYCAERMPAEQGFLSALKDVKQWHMEGASLVLEGGPTRLLLAPAGAAQPN